MILVVFLAFLAAVTVTAIASVAVGARRHRRRAQADARRVDGARVDAAIREAALGAIADGVVVFGADGQAGYENQAARRLAGRRVGTVDEVAPDALRSICLAVLGDGRSRELEYTLGPSILHAEAMPTDSGGVVLVLRDVTAARTVDSVRRDFVANASHELKTPVSSIAALSEALHEALGHDAAATERFVALLQDESHRLARLVTDLLDLSRLEGGAPDAERVSLSRVALEEARRLRARAEAAGIELVVDAAGDVQVNGSESDLGLLVHNLLDNAIHYSPAGGRVHVSVEDRDGSATLTVSDTGIGIASKDLDRVFERFYRADPARSRESGGTGLGLSIVKHVAETHGGDVRVQSVLGAGSTFTVRLPSARLEPD